MRVSRTEITGLADQVVSENSNGVVADELSRTAQTRSISTNNNPNVDSIMDFAKIKLPPLHNKDTYISFPNERTVRKVLEEVNGSEELKYRVKMGAGHTETITFDNLIALDNGRNALSTFQNDTPGSNSDSESSESDVAMVSTRPMAKRRRQKSGFTDLTNVVIADSDGDLSVAHVPRLRRRGKEFNGRATRNGLRSTRNSAASNGESASDSNDSSPDSGRSVRRTKFGNRKSTRMPTGRVTRSSIRAEEADFDEHDDEEDESSERYDDEEMFVLQSDVLPRKRKRKRGLAIKGRAQDRLISGMRFEKARSAATRQSDRSTRHQLNMQEIGVNDVYRSESDTTRPAPKAVGAREIFQVLPSGNRFQLRHCRQCDTCGNYGSGAHGQLIHCQGCTLSYHKTCLGHRTTRDHLVTKVGDADFVLQCRRCVNVARKKEATAPDQGMCQTCREVGSACHPFRERKTPLQEEREREANGGIDPIVEVERSIINNANNVLFRCMGCWRSFHFHHLLSRSDVMDSGEDDETIAEQRFRDYTRDWKCRECVNMPAKVSGLIAWRPIDPDGYVPGFTVTDVNEDDKEYLIKWEDRSYFQAQWMPGAWTWGATVSAMRRAFAKKHDGNNLPTMSTEDAIPEDYLSIDTVLDVRFTSIVDTRAEEVDKARIREVDRALIKYKGLGYEDAVWEKVPGPEDGDRWKDFVLAYDDWVMGRYVKPPKAQPLKTRLEKVRSTDFNTLEKKKQPESLVGGELMKYQLEGVNWLYYRWYMRQNAILADEMGLGKTIQIIGLLATLVQEHNCLPFLIVVPNSTCANWRRELKQWAPSLRVVTYFGSSAARNLAYQYELYPEGSKDLKCHVVVTSYDAAADDSCRRFFKSVPWQGLIVDEGQRLKNDSNLLYNALTALKIPFKVLLTGTPLQNNARELFNLLQFLDESFDASALELEYAELTKENVPQLHNLIRPFFLRRTKAQVLTFLPPMAQIIVPVSMSVLQKKLYMSILTKNPDLVQAIFDPNGRALRQGERANLSNILMQLRKCLCHPFVYSREVEERSVIAAVSHRNLVEASGKLQLLEILLPKLKERGHRVLIFSQFLNVLDIMEDFCDGLELPYQRLDGTMSSLQKQKRIDEFNAPDSPLFAFLLSTRAGGVGINLATADTVLILDPDFNPHQDIQALSRAHRIGQRKKVLCFQLMTRASAEEKIVQIGRKKMALDHVLIEQMDASEDSSIDMESILRYGAAEILEGDSHDIRYDDASVNKLLDRSQVEDTKTGEDNTAESQFSFARVWANDAASMLDSLNSSDSDEKAPDPTVWERILKDREKVAAEEAAARLQVLGRGKRARQMVDYSAKAELIVGVPGGDDKEREGSDSDTDFQAQHSEPEESAGEEPGAVDNVQAELQDVQSPVRHRGIITHGREPQVTKTFRRSNVIWPTTASQIPSAFASREDQENPVRQCIACGTLHREGYCPLKLAGEEYCNLCGLAHYGVARTCPHIQSETQVREMLLSLKQSPESKHLKEAASRYLGGVKGSIVQDKKRKMEKLMGTYSTAGMSELPRRTNELRPLAATTQSRQVPGVSVGMAAETQGYERAVVVAPEGRPGVSANGHSGSVPNMPESNQLASSGTVPPS